MEAYCVKCKEKRAVKDPVATFTSSGTPATKGVCPVCGTGVYRMGKTEAHAGLEPPPGAARKETSKPKRRRTRDRQRRGKLVIVESPAKARTVGRFLGKDYAVRASVGHVRDLLRSKLSVDVENDFRPQYRVPNEKRPIVKDLKSAVAKAQEVYLATDPDREGEAIAWHLLEAAEIEPDRARRVVFHEITRAAVDEAFSHPRQINMDLVNAQQARRILDRLVGYNLSPLLWSKVRSRLSAGRVQSVALRMVVDREREIENFVPREFWSIDGEFLQPAKPPAFKARLTKVDDEKPDLGSEEAVGPLLEDMQQAAYQVARVRRGSRTRRPSAPFITSTLQQDASRRLGFRARRTMRVAQQLYEGIELGTGEPEGLITYMRTDSTQVAGQAQAEARALIRSLYGERFVPEKPPVYRTRARRPQEAHEAIRPTSSSRRPDSIKGFLTAEQYKLYDLIWRRFVASQMSPAEYDTLAIEVEGFSSSHRYHLRVSASSLRFRGFLEVYEEREPEPGKSEEQNAAEARLDRLPDLVQGDALDLLGLHPEQHFTQPPPRYSDASLVRALEEHGIGRPSTYAPILSTIQNRGYVERENRRLVPTEIGILVSDLLVAFFEDILDLGFTARMEERLDGIADGERSWVDVVRSFHEPFAVKLEKAMEQMPEVRAEPEVLERACPECGSPLVIRHGRFGKFVGCSDFPNCRHTEPWLEKIGVVCPLDGGDIVERRTRRGRGFYGCGNYPECEFSSWKRPLSAPCPRCGGLLVQDGRLKASCTSCEEQVSLTELEERGADLA